MNRRNRWSARTVWLLGLCLASGLARAGEERVQLYTEPDPQSPGGIAGHLSRPDARIEQILAIPVDAPEKVYRGEVTGADGRGFRFTGLPMRSYDLLVVYANSFFEGLRLNRGESTLTPADREQVEAIVQKSEPFYNEKEVHRLEGETGQGGAARCITTFLRSKKSDLMFEQYEGKWSRDDFRRTFKLVMLKQVGPGWQVVRTRDLYPVWTKPAGAKPQHHFSEVLSSVRVADKVKDLGELSLEP